MSGKLARCRESHARLLDTIIASLLLSLYKGRSKRKATGGDIVTLVALVAGRMPKYLQNIGQMKNKRSKKQNTVAHQQLKIAYSFDDIFGEDLKSEKFVHTYVEELNRLRLARQMREMRLARKFTQKDVAQKAKMPQSVIARIESGKHSPSLNTLGRIAHVFNKEVHLV